MNKLTHKITRKGYSLTEFFDLNRISLSSYRRWENPKHVKHNDLVLMVDELEDKKWNQ